MEHKITVFSCAELTEKERALVEALASVGDVNPQVGPESFTFADDGPETTGMLRFGARYLDAAVAVRNMISERIGVAPQTEAFPDDEDTDIYIWLPLTAEAIAEGKAKRKAKRKDGVGLAGLLRKTAGSKTEDVACSRPDGTPLAIGDKVRRGPDWKWNEQDGGDGQIGKVEELNSSPFGDPGWCAVRWQNGKRYGYRMGCGGAFDLAVVEDVDPAEVCAPK